MQYRMRDGTICTLAQCSPQSFLTAIMQTTARKNELPLDKMTLMCEVTQMMTKEEINAAPVEGANINGMFLEVQICNHCHRHWNRHRQ